MKKYLLFIMLPFLFCACYVANYGDVRAEEEEMKIFSASQMQKIEVNTRNGVVEAIAWYDDSIQVTFMKWATGDSTGEALDRLDDIKIFITEDSRSGVLSIELKYPSFTGADLGCDVFLSLPASFALELETSNGSITVMDIENDIDCSTSNGAITMRDTQGDAELNTSIGRINVDRHYGDINCRTSNGSADVEVVLPKQGECVIKTSNGSITLSIPDSTSAMVEASTSNGSIEIDNLDISVIEMDKTEFKGKMGDGQGNIDLQTSNGSILIRK